jgi:hypothetical protein
MKDDKIHIVIITVVICITSIILTDIITKPSSHQKRMDLLKQQERLLQLEDSHKINVWIDSMKIRIENDLNTLEEQLK